MVHTKIGAVYQHLLKVLLWVPLCSSRHITGHVNVGIIFYCIVNSQCCTFNTTLKSDWLFNIQSSVMQAERSTLDNEVKAT